MADQTQRLEIATVRTEVGSNIVYRFANDAAAAGPIPTESGGIQNLKQVILEIQAEAAEKISISTTIYPTVAAGLGATANQGIFLVQSDDANEIYAVWKNEEGTAVNTGKTALSATAIQTALDASNEAAQAAEDAADVATTRTARYLAPSATPPVVRDDGLPLQVGDVWFNTVDQSEYRYTDNGWRANDSLQAVADLREELEPDQVRKLATYSALRNYTGSYKFVEITQKGIDGLFVALPFDPMDVDDGATKIVSADGLITWVRSFSGAAYASWWGLNGSGDETSKLQQAFDNSGGWLEFEFGKTYRYNPAIGINVSKPLRLVTNGSIFRETAANTDFSFNITASPFHADSMKFEFVGSGNARFNERGVTISGSNIRIGSISITAENSQTGANNSAYCGIKIGPETNDVLSSSVEIGSISSKNWDRPVMFQNLSAWQVGSIDIQVYRRGIYVKDCKYGKILGGSAKGMSPTSTGKAGENAILLESVAADYATEEIRIYGFAGEDSGEHGFRVGGQKIMRNIWHIGCSTRNTGLGYGTAPLPNDDDHGGCGFKALGPTSVPGAMHQGIHYLSCTVENAIIEEGKGFNFAGFNIGKVYGGSIADCSVIPPEGNLSAISCGNGIELIGCENTQVSNPTIISPKFNGILFYDSADSDGQYWGSNNNISVDGGRVRGASVAAVKATAFSKNMRKLAVKGLKVEACAYALNAEKSGSGLFTGCTFDGDCWGVTTELFYGAADWLISGKGEWIGANVVQRGSIFQDWSSKALKQYAASGWISVDGSFTISLADDAFFSWTPKKSDMWVLISTGGTTYYGQLWVRTTSSPASVKVAGGTNLAVMNSALSGTTGVDGNITVGVQSGTLYIENRAGNNQTITITQLG
ncbi:hypothetical protein [Pseudomonas alloputida]|uniref:hypothetical protein n=1 Tax=Pseudomonas alloputida TaxID=1940621 RepID=UPI003869A97B